MGVARSFDSGKCKTSDCCRAAYKCNLIRHLKVNAVHRSQELAYRVTNVRSSETECSLPRLGPCLGSVGVTENKECFQKRKKRDWNKNNVCKR